MCGYDYAQYLEHGAIEKWRKIGWVFWDMDRLKKFNFFDNNTLDGSQNSRRSSRSEPTSDAPTKYRVASNVETRPLYQETRANAPMLPILFTKVSKSAWEELIVPKFFARPVHAKDDNENLDQVMQLVEYAKDAALGRLG